MSIYLCVFYFNSILGCTLVTQVLRANLFPLGWNANTCIFVKKACVSKNSLLLFVYMSKILANHWAVSVIVRNKILSIVKASNRTKIGCQANQYIYKWQAKKKVNAINLDRMPFTPIARQHDTYVFQSIWKNFWRWEHGNQLD